MRLDAWLLHLPLATPYKLAFGPVEALDTVVVRMVRDDGREGYGEATLLTGYTDETVGETWAKVGEIAGALGSASFNLGATLDGLDASHPFLTTAFRTALEMADGSFLLSLEAPARVPILGLLQAESEERLRAEADALLAQGYRTLKVKVGFDAVRDAAMVGMAQRAVGGRARIRIDANQGYAAREAIEFVSRLSNESIELFEQPCAAGDWDAHARVVPIARDRGIALMLDESIYSEREIEMASERRAADFIKVKLMKFRSLARLAAAIALIRNRGQTPVLGNGVATDLGCWMEACIAARHIDNAGEMNGFLKPRERLLADPLVFRDGCIELPAGWRPRIDVSTLERLAIARETGVRPQFPQFSASHEAGV
ncbi:MAG: enolase C-terminal domain-like protein [Usitatibacter sp.]